VDEFDLVVIGSGTGGYTAAIRAKQHGLSAAIVEKSKVGGACLHRGCIPTKVWLESAETLRHVQCAGDFGIRTGDGASLDFPTLVERQHKVVRTIHDSLRSVIESKHKIEIVEGEAGFKSSNEVVVGDRTLTAKQVVIATGSQPKALPGLEPDGVLVHDSDTLLQVESLPHSIIIIGAGAVGCEFASFFTDIGCEVTLVEMMPTVAPLEEPDIGKALAKALQARGANVFPSARVATDRTRTYDGKVEITIESGGVEKQIAADAALVAVGREAAVADLGLENTVAKIEGGFVAVDEVYRTADPAVYAVGDAIGGMLLAHVAGAEGFIAAEALSGNSPEPLDYSRVPRVIYTHPQIASVGLTLEQAKEAGHNAKSQRVSFRPNAMALIHGETDGLARVVIDQDSGDLLGVHLYGATVSEMISEAALARFLQASAWELGTNIHPHPTLSEALGEAAQLSAGISIYW
jgi:dihydrolipoamide dehydrogenase